MLSNIKTSVTSSLSSGWDWNNLHSSLWPSLLFISPVTCIPVDAREFYITHIAQRRRQRQFEGWGKMDGCFTEIGVHLESLRAVGTSRHIWIRHHIVFVTQWALVWRTHTARGNCRLKNSKLGTCASSFAGMVRSNKDGYNLKKEKKI